jgi:DNA-binding transcriptional MerR regulator
MPTPSLLRIGPFSRLARVTVKTLRFYASAGLFQPIWVDPRSGYRFYCATQLPALRRIRLLRDMGCSIAEIRQLTAGAPGGNPPLQELAWLRKRMLVRAALAEQRLVQLDALLRYGISAPVQAEPVHREPAQTQKLPRVDREIASTPALTVRDCIRSAGNDIHRMFESAERQVARRGGRTRQSPFLLLHDMEYRQPHADVEVCVPIAPELLGSPGVRLVEPVPRAACVRFCGSYEQAPALFDAALDDMQGSKDRIAGPIREVYLRFGADQQGYTLDPRFLADNVGQYRTELQIPLRR